MTEDGLRGGFETKQLIEPSWSESVQVERTESLRAGKHGAQVK